MTDEEKKQLIKALALIAAFIAVAIIAWFVGMVKGFDAGEEWAFMHCY